MEKCLKKADQPVSHLYMLALFEQNISHTTHMTLSCVQVCHGLIKVSGLHIQLEFLLVIVRPSK